MRTGKLASNGPTPNSKALRRLARGGQKKGFKTAFGIEIVTEIEALLGTASSTSGISRPSRRLRAAWRCVWRPASWNNDSTPIPRTMPAPMLPCACGQSARYAGRHSKNFASVLGPLRLERANATLGWMVQVCPRKKGSPGQAARRLVEAREVKLVTIWERRGFERAARQAVLGDGAIWIWNLADEHFPDAVQIVDRFHAKQHLSDVSKSIYGAGSDLAQHWASERHDELDAGEVDAILNALRLPLAAG